jgi:hypothetical protein
MHQSLSLPATQSQTKVLDLDPNLSIGRRRRERGDLGMASRKALSSPVAAGGRMGCNRAQANRRAGETCLDLTRDGAFLPPGLAAAQRGLPRVSVLGTLGASRVLHWSGEVLT